MGRDNDFEEWVFQKTLREAAKECMGLLEILYDEYYEDWKADNEEEGR